VITVFADFVAARRIRRRLDGVDQSGHTYYEAAQHVEAKDCIRPDWRRLGA
jgi:hypothetical protein